MSTVVVLCSDRRPDLPAVECAADVRYVRPTGLVDALPGADVLFAWDFLSTAVLNVWDQADQLRWMHVASAGVDHILAPEVIDSDVVMTNSRGVFDRSIAEYVLGLILLYAKDTVATLDLQRDHCWRNRETEMICGKQVLVVGVGPIGRGIARLLSAVGMRVRGVGRVGRVGDRDFGEILDTATMPAALPEADYVVLAAPLTSQTRGMFGAAEFHAMKSTARVVNVGRGNLIVESELAAALGAGEIAGAALDVFAEEPLPSSSPLWDTPGVVISPHMSADFAGWFDALTDVFTDNFCRWRDGQPLRNVVDKHLGYVPSACVEA